VKAIDTEARTVTLSILDGVQGGNQYFYHLVTDASVTIAAVLEKGVVAPRLAKNTDADPVRFVGYWSNAPAPARQTAPKCCRGRTAVIVDA
jgi:hypothetical protein